MSLEPGTRLDQYEVVAAIGSGAMGDVYKAKDTRLDRVVAIKVITATRDLDAQARVRFDREARALAALSHPHICNVYHYGDAGGTPFIVMEYLEGQTVAQWLRRHGRLPPPDVLRYATEIADGLQAAHAAGIVHRDLKPENVMLTGRGVKLLDLGVSKRLPAAEDSSYRGTTHLALTRLGTVTGTIPYMAPEQLDGHPADVRSDIFSFGAVLYEMATGSRAFKGDSEARIITSIMSSEPPRASSLEPALPAGLDGVIEGCLKKMPAARYQTSSELLAALRQVEAGSGVAGPPVGPAPADPATRPPRRRRRLVIRFSIGISFGALLLAVMVQRRGTPDAELVQQAAAISTSVGPAEAGAARVWQLTINRPTGGTIIGAGGIFCGTAGASCTLTLPDGAPVQLQAETEAGHQFVQFTGDCAASGETIMTGSRTCGATFAPTMVASGRTGAPSVDIAPAISPRASQSPAPAKPTPTTAGQTATTNPPRVAAETTSPPTMAGPPPPPMVDPPSMKPTAPVLAEEEHAKREIAQLVNRYCAAYETLQAEAVQKVFPVVARAPLQAQFAQYRSLKCTVTPPEYERFGHDTRGAGGAQLRFGMTQVVDLKLGGGPRTSETVVTMSVSRRDQNSPWTIDRVSYELKPK